MKKTEQEFQNKLEGLDNRFALVHWELQKVNSEYSALKKEAQTQYVIKHAAQIEMLLVKNKSIGQEITAVLTEIQEDMGSERPLFSNDTSEIVEKLIRMKGVVEKNPLSNLESIVIPDFKHDILLNLKKASLACDMMNDKNIQSLDQIEKIKKLKQDLETAFSDVKAKVQILNKQEGMHQIVIDADVNLAEAQIKLIDKKIEKLQKLQTQKEKLQENKKQVETVKNLAKTKVVNVGNQKKSYNILFSVQHEEVAEKIYLAMEHMFENQDKKIFEANKDKIIDELKQALIEAEQSQDRNLIIAAVLIVCTGIIKKLFGQDLINTEQIEEIVEKVINESVIKLQNEITDLEKQANAINQIDSILTLTEHLNAVEKQKEALGKQQ